MYYYVLYILIHLNKVDFKPIILSGLKNWNGLCFMIKLLSIILKLEFKILSWASKCLKPNPNFGIQAFFFETRDDKKWLPKSEKSMRLNSTACAEECRTIDGHMPYLFEADILFLILTDCKRYLLNFY